ncbi:hypothetical protein J7E70_02225 [Variovorax paradoxus]|nr:hypothetical protein [Variovorax paradoxus]MBT2299270.1 hypothetical protein [Variovorax paradoxus]
MDAATLQDRINKGYGKAAARLGILHSVARPLTAAAPLLNIQGTLLCSFNAEDWKYLKPNKYGRPTWYGLFDGSLTRAGDYLIGPAVTYFIAAQQPLLSILCVDCNRQVALLRPPPAAASTGAQGYGGTCAADSTPALGTVDANGALVNGWPCSILLGGRQEHGTNLPMAVNNAGFQILLPPSVPIVIRASDIFLDDLGRRYIAEAAELSDLGWRINAREAHV